MRYICTSIVATLMLASTGIAWADDAVQWTEAEGGNGHWYEFQDGTGSNWNNHRQAALAVGGDLACPIDESTHTYLKYLMETMGDCVNLDYISIGGLQTQGQGEPAGGWHWVSGAEWSWTNWHPSEPNDSGGDVGDGEWALVYTGANCGGLWNDINPTLDDNLNRGYIIEWSADCNGDGIVDYGQIRDGTYADDDGNGVPDCCDAGTPCDTPANAPVQWTEADGGNGHWYKVIINDTALCWPEAEATAMATGGQLASLETVEEFNFASIHIDSQGGSPDTWIGLRQDEDGAEPADGWRWLSGVELDYNLWLGSLDDGNGCQDFARLEAGGCDDVYPCVEEECIHSTYEDQMLVEWSADCNDDGIVDYGQILDGLLEDLNENGVPDCCELPGGCEDCNDNGVLDSEDLANGTSQDCNANDIPDECEIADGTSLDCNANSIPDECESLADCDGDGTSDACELLAGAIDTNPADGIPDECQGSPSGACCFGSQCVRVTLANCSSSGGEYFGDGSSCADSPCGPSGTGACCLNGACISATLEDCFVAGGSFAGSLAGCSDVSCPVECTGDANNDGVVNIEDLLVMLSGWGPCP